jgi:aminoglycoside/choline kinase family phosphotransferase
MSQSSAGFPQRRAAASAASIGTAADTAELSAWIGAVGFQAREIRPLTGDVSPRRYFRALLRDGGTVVAAAYPPEAGSACSRFLRTNAILESAAVRVPRVLAADCDQGWMLLEDLGPQTLGEWGKGRPWRDLALWFERALDVARRIARLDPAEVEELNPALGRDLLARELGQTWELFLEPQGLVGDPALAAELRPALDAICAGLAAGPPVPCHRDFMARNLMPLHDSGDLAVLDHQDLRPGPPFYDVASLLNDTLFPPAAAEEALLAAALSSPDDRERYHRAAAQRTLKAVGTYASFARRGALRHLPLIAPTLRRFVGHFARIPEGEGLAPQLAAAWRSALEPES